MLAKCIKTLYHKEYTMYLSKKNIRINIASHERKFIQVLKTMTILRLNTNNTVQLTKSVCLSRSINYVNDDLI